MSDTITKLDTSWRSERLDEEIHVVRWGHAGSPVLLFPTAGGDAEEIERMLMIKVLGELLDEGRIRVFSVDSLAARQWGETDVPGASKARFLNRFEEVIRHEVVPAIRADCEQSEATVIAAGASIGAFNALAAVCRWPDAFAGAVCMSGSYDVERFMKNVPDDSTDLHVSSPQRFLPDLDTEGEHIATLRKRFVVMAHGGGRWEDPQQDWRMADLLGSLGIPNRVDAWGEEYDHDWPTWRVMLPKYLDELVEQS